jgi:CheY-like chemotaxis protein
MPNITGIELAQEMMRSRPDIPVILCTGCSEAITPEKAKALGGRPGCDDKPRVAGLLRKTVAADAELTDQGVLKGRFSHNFRYSPKSCFNWGIRIAPLKLRGILANRT